MKKYFLAACLILAFSLALAQSAFCAEAQKAVFPKITVTYSEPENMHKLTKITGYQVFEWDDEASCWKLSDDSGDIDLGFVIIDQRLFQDFYIITAPYGAHSSNTIVIVPKAKKIFCFSSGTPVTYFNYDAYTKNKVFEVVSEFNDCIPCYAEGAQYTLKWRWKKDTFELVSAVKNKK